MHHCLCVDEIVRLIASELVAAESRASAVALACCSRNFEDPVLDVLWATQWWLDRLLGTLPGQSWGPTRCISYQRLPTTQEWVRFQKYSRRIQTLAGQLATDLLSSEVFSLLQSRTSNGHLLQNLKTLKLWLVRGDSIRFIPLFLCPQTTSVTLGFRDPERHKTEIASMITTLPTLCPNLREITLEDTPSHPIITAAVSELLLTTNRNSLRSFLVDSPLTKEAREVVYKLPSLRQLRFIIEGPTPVPTMVLPNLAKIDIRYNHQPDWLQGFCEASLGNLASVIVRSESDSIGDFLEAFKSVAITTSMATTLTSFLFFTWRPWRPNYRALLPFTQLNDLVIEFSCDPSCSSTIDDDIITELARAMPKLKTLRLGNGPCDSPAGVTTRGLSALARYCPHLLELCIHFLLASLDPLDIPTLTSTGQSVIPRSQCALSVLQVGSMPVPEGSTLMVTLTLLRIFPCLENITYEDEGWEAVSVAIYQSKQLTDWSWPGGSL